MLNRNLYLRLSQQRLHPRFSTWAVALVCASVVGTASATAAEIKPPPGNPHSPLKAAFDAAWARQPDGQTAAWKQQAIDAQRRMATAWTPAPLALEVSGATDALQRNEGALAFSIGAAAPLWLPGERATTAQWVTATERQLLSQTHAAQLRTAQAVRDAYWAWQKALADVALAQTRLHSTQKLLADVTKRVKAGDMARADQHQAEGQVAAAGVLLSDSQSQLLVQLQQWMAWTGQTPDLKDAQVVPEAVPPVHLAQSAAQATHPLLALAQAQLELAHTERDLAQIQTRAHSELSVGVSRERGARPDVWQQKIGVTWRMPLGADARQQAKLATAQAQALEMDIHARLLRERMPAQLQAARQSVDLALVTRAAADQRARLARETLGFIDKSFQVGESDLPTRLRVEMEAAEAAQQAAHAHIQHAQAISSLRQHLGLLPE